MRWPCLAYVITILVALALLLASCAPNITTGGRGMADLYLAYQTASAATPSTQNRVEGFTAAASDWSDALAAPSRIVAASDGVLYLGPPSASDVKKYDASGALAWTWTAPDVNHQLDAVDDGAGGAYIADSYNLVRKVDNTGTTVWTSADPTAAGGRNYGETAGIALSADGSVVFALVSPVITGAGNTDAAVVGIDSSDGSILWVKSLTTDSQTNMLIADLENFMIRTAPGTDRIFVTASETYSGVAIGRIIGLAFAGAVTSAPTVSWANDWTSDHTSKSVLTALDVTSGLVLVGGAHANSGSGNDYIVAAYDATGTLQWRYSGPNFAADNTEVQPFGLAATPSALYVGINYDSVMFPTEWFGWARLDPATGVPSPNGAFPLEAYYVYSAAAPHSATTTTLPPLDSPVRVDLSEDLTGRFSDVGIQLDYLPNHDIAKSIGERIAIGDQITPTDPLYTFWIKTKSWRGGLVNYTGETVLGRLDDLEPPTLALVGPFTARQALTKMLDHFQSAAGGWLTTAALPELLVPTAVGPYAPTIKALVLKQADPNDPTAKRTTALEWLQQFLGLFEGYVLRANQAGELQIVPPAWASAGNSAYFGTYDNPTPISSAAGYTQSWPWSGTQAQLDLQIIGDGDRYVVTYHAEMVDAGTPNAFHMTLASDAYTITWEITGGMLTLTITPDDPSVTKDYSLNGVAINPTPTSLVAKTIPTAAITMSENSELDVDYVANICEVNSRGQDYVAGFEAWSPAYIDNNPKPVYPAGLGGLTGTAVQWFDGTNRTTWLPDPGSGYGREKIDTAWKVADPATIIEAGTPITLTLGFDAYWSAQPLDYVGNCIPTPKQIAPEPYPDNVAFTITDANGVQTTEGGGLPHTLADITLPADGREITVHMLIIRVGVSGGRIEQTLKIGFNSTTGEIRIRTVNSVLAAAGGGRSWCNPSPWFLAPRWTLNATATAFTAAAESVTGIWGETDQLGDLAGLAESQSAYGKRKLTIDAGPFHLDQATCLAIAEAIVRARFQPMRVYTLEQARAYPLRPDDGNSLIQIGTTSIRGTMIARDYQEAHTPQRSVSSAAFRLRAVETLPELAQALAEDRLDIAALDQGVITE